MKAAATASAAHDARASAYRIRGVHPVEKAAANHQEHQHNHQQQKATTARRTTRRKTSPPDAPHGFDYYRNIWASPRAQQRPPHKLVDISHVAFIVTHFLDYKSDYFPMDPQPTATATATATATGPSPAKHNIWHPSFTLEIAPPPPQQHQQEEELPATTSNRKLIDIRTITSQRQQQQM